MKQKIYLYLQNKGYDPLFISLNPSENIRCYKNYYSMGLSITPLVESILSYLLDNQIKNLILVGIDEEFTNNFISYFLIRLDEYDIKVDSQAIMAGSTFEDAVVIANSIVETYKNGGFIINTATSFYNKELFKAFYEQDITDDHGYTIFNVFLSEHDIAEYGTGNNYVLFILFIV